LCRDDIGNQAMAVVIRLAVIVRELAKHLE